MRGSGLLERDDAVAALGEAVERARAGQGATCLISGPAGIGKTALLEAAAEIARRREGLVLPARASELDRGFGFGIVHQLLEPVVRACDEQRRERLFAGAARRAEALFGAAAVDGDPEYGVLNGLHWLIANLADERPLVLCVDDLHWADPASLRLLEFLGRRIDGLPVLTVCTLRPEEPGAPVELLAALRAAPACATVEPAPLSAPAAGAMLADALAGPPSERFRDAAWRATGGNPLLLSLLAREAAANGLRGRAEEAERLPELAAPGVAPTVVRRLARLDPDATAVARAAAVAGERARLDDVVALAGLDLAATRAALADLADLQLVASGGWRYVHPLVRSAVASAMPHAERDRLHRLAAARLRERGARPAEVALHWLATAPARDPGAVADLRAAAREAAAEGATGTAVELLRRALAEDAELPDRPRLLLELAELELRMLLPEGPARMREALTAGLERDEEARGRAALGTVLLLSDPVAAFAEIDQARAQAGDRGERLRLEAAELEALCFVDALAEPRLARYEAIRAARDPSAAELAHLASEEALAGQPVAEVAALAERAAADGALLREVGPGGSTWSLLTHALRFAERPEPARRLLLEGDRVVRERGLRTAGAFVDQSWAYWHRDFGSVARGLAHAQAGYEGVLEAGVPVSVAAVAAIVAESLVLLDRVEEAEAVIDRPLGAAEGTFVEVFALTARGMTRAAAERHGEAERDLRRVVEILDRRGWRAPAAARGRMRLAELLAGSGRAEEARELIDHDVAAARGAGAIGALGATLRVRALAQEGRERLATLREAVAALAASPLRLEHGRALLALGATLRRRGELEEARETLRAALDAASRTESARLAREVRAELEASGARPRRERISGVESLTPSERRVAELAADGLTNRQIAEALWVTRKTVEYHLGHVYSKLRVRSRAALPAALERSAGAETPG
ncbi:AAA family ATPase [Conexibacter arvalis]|uniref:DNA-binding CsgD family transcriptional regulator n=1 Tax=Conexibacter arvalis TaxID=912552 RepID=A0A840IKJ2_9ACTN|nr:DNA-binding CsgD family transcriptional regulator [Conexibacter arvalis]